jgi:DNA polymerase-3 subunit gamma/tau
MELLSTSLRPRKLSEVYGQPVVVNELQKAWSKGGFPQALLLKGMSGCGKTTVAQIIAMMLNCHHPEASGDPCGKCSSCQSIIQEEFDQNTYRLDGGSASKDEVIDFAAMASVSPMYNTNNIFIIEEADQLSTKAKNSLLKVLEKPYKNTYFILLSMIPNGLPPAIQSRCQVKNFKPFKAADVMYALRESLIRIGKWDIPEITNTFYLDVLPTIADASGGSLREATQLLENCLTAEYYTSDLVKSNIGIVSSAIVADMLFKLLEGDKSFFNDFDTMDYSEFFNMGYYIIANANQYKITKQTANEYYEAQTKKLADHIRLSRVLAIFDEVQKYSNGYIKKSFLVSQLTQYYLSLRVREPADD